MGIFDRKYMDGSFFLGHAWDFYARFYDAVQPRMIRFVGAFGDLSYDEFEEEFISLARLEPGMSVLDVACGSGAGLPALSRALGPKGDIVSVDISAEMLHRASTRARRLKIRNATFQKVDAEKLSLDFDEESFDAAVCCNGIPNFIHPLRAVIEMAYVLREGGMLAFSTINHDKLDDHPAFRWMAKYPEGRLPYKEEYRKFLGESGLDRIRFHERGLMLIVTARKNTKPKARKRGTPTGRKSKSPRQTSRRKTADD